MYNKSYYEACDLLMGISKQTVNINRIVLGDKAKDRILKYIPHGLDVTEFSQLPNDDKGFLEFKKGFLKNVEQ